MSQEYTHVTSDGGVQKRVVVEGTGDEPPLHAQCLGWVSRRIPMPSDSYMCHFASVDHALDLLRLCHSLFGCPVTFDSD